MRLLGVLMVFLSFSLNSYAQLAAGFTMPLNACQQEKIGIINSSLNAAQSEWDFCALDIERSPTISDVYGLPGFLGGFGYKMVSDNGLWYAFALNYTGNLLYRLDFGSDPQSTPQFVNLGNPNDALSKPQSIDLIKTNGKWYGFVGYDATGFGVVRLDFGTSLGNTPTAANIGAFGFPSSIVWDLRVVNQGGNLILILLDRANDSIIRINYRGSFDNTISAGDIYPISSIPGASSLFSLELVNQGVNWLVLLTSYFNNRIITLNFGSDLLQNFGSSSFFSSPILDQPIRIRIVKDSGKNYALVSNNSAGVGMGLGLIDYGDFQTTPIGISTTLPALFSVDGIRWQGKTIVTGLGGSSTVKRLIFQNLCGASQETSDQFNPQSITYSTSGLKDVSLIVKNSLGYEASIVKIVLISSLQAPDVNFTSINNCASNNVNFTSQNNSGNITDYAWNFGDTNSSPLPNPAHIYTTAATYPVTLQVTASNGCINTARSDVSIYDQPIADFTIPSTNPFCTNQNYVFTNQSVFDLASNPTWEWRLNGTLVSSSQNLIQSFATSSSQEIRLKAKIPGCENEIIKNVTTVLPGPLSNFTFTNGCQASPVSFTNTTSGSVTSYSWIFGDGNTSSLSNASNTYANIGSYDVTLQANNAAGCQNSVTKSITIYSTPQPDFSIGLPPFSCAGSSSQFTDQTPAPTDSNITWWTWGFGDAANGSSSVKNPSYTYATANTYNVSLAVATNFGCTNSIQKSVTISPSPVAGFSNLPACVNQTTQFTDISSGSIRSRLWQIQSNTFSTANPQYTFPASGTFPVVLTVTGNNNCVGQASKNIVVPIVPSLDFSVQAPCADSPTVFTELTTSVDPSISKSWSFGSQGTGNGSPAQYAFSSTGTYVVRLNSTRQSGCIYSVSKNVTIISPPVADFVPSIDAGAAPLPVSFANNSSGANSYLWKFGDPGNSTSILVSPTFVFSELGAYNVELSASNSVGCTNRISKPISVVIPKVDAEMTDFFFVKDTKTGSLQPVVKLLNRSNITLTNPIILLDVAGGSGVSQQITGTIKPNQEISQMLDLKLVPKTNQYVCAEVVVVGDTDTFLNRKCLSLSGEEVLFTPFPNPAREQLNMDWISIDGSAVTFQVLTSAGAVSFQQTISSINPGLNRLIINISALLPGIYFIRFSDSKTDRTFSFAVTGN